MSSTRNAGESAICPVRAQPSAEIVRVECAKRCDLAAARATLWKRRRECDLPAARAQPSAEMVRVEARGQKPSWNEHRKC